MTDNANREERRQLRVLAGVIAAYLAAVVGMAALGHFTFVFKVLVIPSFFLVAAATRRLRLFANDWAVFLALTALFDTLRGLIFHLTMTLDRMVYMNYVIDLDRLLGGGRVPTIILQDAISDVPRIRFLEKFLVVVHGSHFLFFLLFALLVWYVRRHEFLRFQVGMLLVMYGGLLGYFLVPTVPPWMAGNLYQAIPLVFHFPEKVYNTALPELFAIFDVNPVAAMPSLHTAFPVFCCCVGLQLFGRRALGILAYVLVVVFALVYSGEHYLIDALAGAALAVAAWLATFRLGPLARRLRRQPGPVPTPPWPAVGRRLGVAAVVVAAWLVGGGQLAAHSVEQSTSRNFIDRELKGRTATAPYFEGLLLEQEGQTVVAQERYQAALAGMTTPTPLRQDVLLRLGVVAHKNGDHQLAIQSLLKIPWDDLRPMDAAMLGLSLLETGRREQGENVFVRMQQTRPGEPISLYWLTRLRLQDGRISAAEVRSAAARIRAAGGGPGIAMLADQLEQLAARGR